MATRGNIKVIINGREFETDELFVVIPWRYRAEFEGHVFKNMTEFSKAVMFARCAEEAETYRVWHQMQRDEETMRNILANGW